MVPTLRDLGLRYLMSALWGPGPGGAWKPPGAWPALGKPPRPALNSFALTPGGAWTDPTSAGPQPAADTARAAAATRANGPGGEIMKGRAVMLIMGKFSPAWIQ
jgi:hypothetical protein